MDSIAKKLFFISVAINVSSLIFTTAFSTFQFENNEIAAGLKCFIN